MPGKPDQHAARDRADPERSDARRQFVPPSPALWEQRRRELAQVVRIAARRLVTGAAKLLVGARPEHTAYHDLGCFFAQRLGPQDVRCRVRQRRRQAR